MSQENVELVREGFERFNAGEREPIPEQWHSEAEYIPDRRDPEPAPHHGVDAIARVFRGWVDAYPDLRVEPLEMRSHGDRVFVWARFVGQGAGSGVAIDMERAQVYTIERARIRQVEEYFDRAEALEAAGLRE